MEYDNAKHPNLLVTEGQGFYNTGPRKKKKNQRTLSFLLLKKVSDKIFIEATKCRSFSLLLILLNKLKLFLIELPQKTFLFVVWQVYPSHECLVI
jgi:hypothetical protein